MLKIVSWNVNGFRAVIKKGFVDFVKSYKPDVLCLQETKSSLEPIVVDLPGYTQYWNHAKKKGYSGTAIFTKIKPLSIKNDLGISKHDDEGRVMTAEFSEFFLVNVYVPNSKRDLTRLDYRTQEWDVDFLKHCKALEKKKPVIFCGDLNVAHAEIDLTYPKPNINNHGFTPQERAGFDSILKVGFLDAFRNFEKKGGHYTWWSPMGDCRKKNIGWRIDYFCVSAVLQTRIKSCLILKDILGSDHCPIELSLQ